MTSSANSSVSIEIKLKQHDEKVDGVSCILALI